MLVELRPSDTWVPVSIAPFGADLEVCVIGKREIHALAFPCCRADAGWVDAKTQRRLDIDPTHWRKWVDSRPLVGAFADGRRRLGLL